MVNIIVELSKYLMIALMLVYTFECFAVFNYADEYTQRSIFRKQNVLMFLLHMIAFLVMYLQTNETKMIGFYGMQVVLFLAVILLYTKIYPRVSRLVVNNMCMLMAIGFIMITRLSYSLAVKQFIIVSASVAISLVIPVIIRKVKALSEWKIFYAIAGVVMLGVVIIVGRVTGGAMLNVAIGGFTLQPSELVKIIFVFFVAASLKDDTSFKNIVITTAVAAMHVLILVVSKDLGAALIIFAVYLMMLYVASRQPLYVIAGLIAGSGASVVAYKLFNHVRVRVLVWKDPFAVYNEGGYQVAQSLMAIGTGSWFGMGLFQGAADQIPVAESDFIFSAIAEEMGLIFALCLILVCVSVYMMFLNIAMQLRDSFSKLVALGDNKGAVVVMEPSTGKILAMVSKPSFDPNNVSENWDALNNDENSSLLNRATLGQYTPGSTFKLVTTLAFMRQNPDYNNYSFECNGEFSQNGATIHCYNSTAHGEENLTDSVANSCNSSFSNIGLQLDKAEWRKTAKQMLFNSKLPGDVKYNESSFRLKTDAGDADTMMTAIGQGETQVSPYHMAMIVSTIANGGKLMKPYLVDKITNYAGTTVKKYMPESYKELMTSSEAAQLTEYMKAVVDYGTGAALSGASYTVAGKTGTAEVSEDGNTVHSWFVGFSNVDNPELAISVCVEDADTATITGVSVAKQVFDSYYNN